MQNPLTPRPVAEEIHHKVAAVVGPEDIEKASSTSTKMLLALSALGKHIYEGTVPSPVIARRRAANKRARVARKAARR